MDSAQPSENFGMIVLAAGASRRMNEPKQLLRVHDKTMLRRVAVTARATVFRPIVIVLGANAELLRNEVEIEGVLTVVNEDWQNGMSSSLKAGLRELLRVAPETAAVLVVLADQPLIETKHLDEFARVFSTSEVAVVAAEYGDTIGAPALFSRSVFSTFDELEGDAGAKSVIRRFSENLVTISLPEAAFDIDTPEDFRKLRG